MKKLYFYQWIGILTLLFIILSFTTIIDVSTMERAVIIALGIFSLCIVKLIENPVLK